MLHKKTSLFLLLFVLSYVQVSLAQSYSCKDLFYYNFKFLRESSHYKDADFEPEKWDVTDDDKNSQATYDIAIDSYTFNNSENNASNNFALISTAIGLSASDIAAINAGGGVEADGRNATHYAKLYNLLKTKTSEENLIITQYNDGESIGAKTLNDNKYHLWILPDNGQINMTGCVSIQGTTSLIIIGQNSIINPNGAGRFEMTGTSPKLCIQGKDKTSNRVTIDCGNYNHQTWSLIRQGSGHLHLLYTDIKKYFHNTLTTTPTSILYMMDSNSSSRTFISHSSMCDNEVRQNNSVCFYLGANVNGTNPAQKKSRLYIYESDFLRNNSTQSTKYGSNAAVVGTNTQNYCRLRAKNCRFSDNQGYVSCVSIGCHVIESAAIFAGCTFEKNQSQGSGAAINAGGNISIKRCKFINNYSKKRGGAISISLCDCRFIGNTNGVGYQNRPLIANLYKNNGNVWNRSMEIDNQTIFEGNHADQYGGAIYYSNNVAGSRQNGNEMIFHNVNAQVIINGSQFKNNYASNGGAIAMYLNYMGETYKTGIIVKNGALIDGNYVTSPTTGGIIEDGNGGAFWLYATEKADSVCYGYGCEGIQVQGATVKNNRATVKGGAFYQSTPNGAFTITGGEISANNSQGNGGAIFVDRGSFNMSGGNVLQNEAANSGGGIYITNGTQMSFSDGLITHNKAAVTGGGIYLGEGSAESNTSINLGGSDLGIYSNIATTTCADDIYSDGTHTSLTIPNINSMALRGFIGNATGLNWYTDFSTDRYRATRKDENIYAIPLMGKTITDNIALTMGYKGVDLIISQMGVNEGETIIYTIKDQEDLSKILYRVALSGVSQQSVRGLPMKEYVVAPTRWSWAYQSLSGKTQHLQDNNVFEFEAVHKTDDASAGAPMHNEISETNELNGTSH